MTSIYASAMSAAEIAMRLGSHASAKQRYEEALSEEPGSAEAHAGLSLCLSFMDRRFGAEIEAHRALELDPELPAGLIALGHAALSMGDFRGARQAAARVLSLAPESPSGLALECSVCLWERQGAKLRRAATALLARAPEDPFGKYMLSRAASIEGRGVEAEQLAREALRQAPEDKMAHEAIGWAFLQQGRYAKAMDAGRNALAMAPDNASAFALLATATLRARRLTGWMFFGALWAMQKSEQAFITLVIAITAIMTFAVDILSHYGREDWVNFLNVGSWVFAIIWLGSFVVLNRILAAEARAVQLTSDY